MMTHPLLLRVERVQTVAKDVQLFALASANNEPLPPFDAGSHIELQLPNGLARSYSLLNAPGTVEQYLIAVHKSPSSVGGSIFLHEKVAEGDVFQSTAPRNLFALHEGAAHSCLIAGGIGITPLMAMAQRLSQLGRTWELHYCARTPEHAAFVSELTELAAQSEGTVHFYFDQVSDGKALDINQLVQTAGPNTHFYCCGPVGMLNAFEAATADCSERAHMEYFSAKSEAALEGGYEVVLSRSGLSLPVPAGSSILEVVTQAGINVLTSCREGICGSCETTILEGEADHRDAILSPDEQAEHKTMMICCSGAKSARLVLDL